MIYLRNGDYEKVLDLLNSKIRDKEAGVLVSVDEAGVGMHFKTFEKVHGIGCARVVCKESCEHREIRCKDTRIPDGALVHSDYDLDPSRWDEMVVWGYNRETGRHIHLCVVEARQGAGERSFVCPAENDEAVIVFTEDGEAEAGFEVDRLFLFRPVGYRDALNGMLDAVVEHLSAGRGNLAVFGEFPVWDDKYLVDRMKAAGVYGEAPVNENGRLEFKAANGATVYVSTNGQGGKFLKSCGTAFLFEDGKAAGNEYAKVLRFVSKNGIALKKFGLK